MVFFLLTNFFFLASLEEKKKKKKKTKKKIMMMTLSRLRLWAPSVPVRDGIHRQYDDGATKIFFLASIDRFSLVNFDLAAAAVAIGGSNVLR